MGNQANVALGRWLRGLRREAGLTQEEAAERAGLSARTVSNLELGRSRRPYPRSVRLLAGALGVPEPVTEEMIARQRGGSGHPPVSSGLGEGSVLPRQLPTAVPHFVGRAAELRRLSAILDGPGAASAVAIPAILGTAGVGKTTLAVHWAHQVADRFPDGQIYVNLRGFDPSGRPVPPGEAIRGFLDALGVPVGQIPASPDSQAGLYRSLVAGRRMLILLDNAHDSEQVRPLLPGSPGCLALVTSRSPLTGLIAAENACPVSLDVLSPAEAGELLGHRLRAGQVTADPTVTAELAELCARLPMALTIVAAKVAVSPDRPLTELATGLRDTRRRLDLLDTADPATALRAVFSWSCRQLGRPAARMFRLLGIHPGPDISLPAAASLAGMPTAQARAALAELAGAHLASEHRPGRFTAHDLLRAYAAEECETREPGTERRAAIGRVLDHYLQSSRHATAALYPQSPALALFPPSPPAPGTSPEAPGDRGQALAWFEAEHQVLIAASARAADGFDDHAVRIPLLIHQYLHRRAYWQDCTATGLTALAAARRLGHTAAQAYAHSRLARTYNSLGEFSAAQVQWQQALALYQQLGDHRGQGIAHGGLQIMADRQQRHADALRQGKLALRHFRAAGSREGEAAVLNNLGWSHVERGRPRQALPLIQRALDLQRGAGASIDLAYTWDSLGYAHHLLGEYPTAVTCYQRAAALTREFADLPLEAIVLVHLGNTHQAAGDTPAAHRAWQQALDIIDDLERRGSLTYLKELDPDQIRANLAGRAGNDHVSSGQGGT
jgi:tetratricopeptide (TPR) repeat protein/transcriptional regulator with XRE-family HTH domain